MYRTTTNGLKKPAQSGQKKKLIRHVLDTILYNTRKVGNAHLCYIFQRTKRKNTFHALKVVIFVFTSFTIFHDIPQITMYRKSK